MTYLVLKTLTKMNFGLQSPKVVNILEPGSKPTLTIIFKKYFKIFNSC